MRLTVAAVELWFEHADVVLLQAEYLFFIGVLLQVNDRITGALVFVLDDAPEDVAGLAHVDTGVRSKNEIQEI